MNNSISNFNNEVFTPLRDLQIRMEKIANTLKNNFERGKQYIPGDVNDNNCRYIAVSDLINNRKSREHLKLFINNMGYHFNNEKPNPNDFRGIYVFAEISKGRPSFQYVGLSKKTTLRIKEHFYKGDKDTASWAYLMARHENDDKLDKEIKSIKFKSSKEKEKLTAKINQAIQAIQTDFISQLYISFVPVNEDNFFLHMVEPYVACALKSKWNTFEVH